MSEKVNGFANYATWAVCLWLDNEQGTQRYWSGLANDAKYMAATNGGNARDWLAEHLADELTENAPELNGMWSDLLNHAIGQVDWNEVADHFLAE